MNLEPMKTENTSKQVENLMVLIEERNNMINELRQDNIRLMAQVKSYQSLKDKVVRLEEKCKQKNKNIPWLDKFVEKVKLVTIHDPLVNFGMHKGKKMSEIPEDQLYWYVKNGNNNMSHQCIQELSKRHLASLANGLKRYN
jgi:uncharacterized protein (DUF3820 family)